ncbi:MAG: dihydroorotate dehydrogenase, partial [bacterium]|nr:dihydroorotate dehydrogenase [bacterium]
MKNKWIKIKKVEFSNPILTASGTFGFGTEFKQFCNINILGGIFTKGLTLKERPGNSGKRLFETAGGLLNSIGLENPGLKRFKDEIIPSLNSIKTNIFVNISGETIDEFRVLVEELDSVSLIKGFEINVSCPNLKDKGRVFGRSTKTVSELCKKLRPITSKLLIFKLSPAAENIIDQAVILEKHRVDALTICNTYPGLALNKSYKPFFKKTFAGLSGPAIKPLTMRLVWLVTDAVKIPVIASGG